MAAKKNKHIGGTFEDFLREDGLFEVVDAAVQKRIIAEQLREAMDALSSSRWCPTERPGHAAAR
jgi:hypothetical protein